MITFEVLTTTLQTNKAIFKFSTDSFSNFITKYGGSELYTVIFHHLRTNALMCNFSISVSLLIPNIIRIFIGFAGSFFYYYKTK